MSFILTCIDFDDEESLNDECGEWLSYLFSRDYIFIFDGKLSDGDCTFFVTKAGKKVDSLYFNPKEMAWLFKEVRNIKVNLYNTKGYK